MFFCAQGFCSSESQGKKAHSARDGVSECCFQDDRRAFLVRQGDWVRVTPYCKWCELEPWKFSCQCATVLGYL